MKPPAAAPAAAAQPAVVFEGPVDCIVLGAGRWRLRGRSRPPALPGGSPAADPVATELLLAGAARAASSPDLPLRLHELRIDVTRLAARPGGEPGTVADAGSTAPTADEAPRFELQLQAREGCIGLRARALSLHYDARRAFHRAVPGVALPLRTRLAWAALLTALRLPLMSRLLNRPAR